MGRTIDMVLLGLLEHFETITHAKALDVVEHNGYVYIVERTQVGKAVGKGGIMIRRLEQTLKKPVRIVAFDSDAAKFLQNLLYPIKPKNITREGDTLIISDNSIQVKGRIIGRDKANIEWLTEMISRHFGPLQITVV